MAQSLEDVIADLVRTNGRTKTVTFIPEPDPEPLFCPIISADDHALEPPTLFEGRLPRKLQDRAPYLEYSDDGLPWWIVEGRAIPIMQTNGVAGRVPSEWGRFGMAYDEVRRGVWDPAARLHDMDVTGVWASLCFSSTIWGFAGTKFSQMADPELGLACLRAYNDWHLEEWCAAAPERYIPNQLTWLRDPVTAAEEIYRNAERGFRAVSFSENPEPLGFPNIYDEYWDPFLRACEETETVVNLHVGSSGTMRNPSTSSPPDVQVTLFPVHGLEALVDWTHAGVPARFPNIKIVLSEGGVSWFPMVLERLQRAERAGLEYWPAGRPGPVELARRGFYFTSIEDPSAFRLLDIIGEDRVMVETDYPHRDSTWPESQQMVRGELAHLPAETVRKVCHGNASKVYRWTPPPQEMIQRSETGAAAAV